jgi:Predicted flavin-nucleotide-binding protein
MNHEEYQQAAEYWNIKDAESVKMEHSELWSAMEEYIKANDTGALATGSGCLVRCTPIEYNFHDEAFWMFSEGGQKFAALETNQKVCFAIFDKYSGFGSLKGMQVSGTAEIVEPYSEEYVKAAEYKHIPIETLKKLPQTMHLIRVIPERIDFLNSDFKKKGYASRQFIQLQ